MVLIGFFKVDVGLLMEYFLLLIEWLKEINEEEGNFFGWVFYGCLFFR